VNQVPDSCVIELDRRMLPGETRQQVWQEFESLIHELHLRDPDMAVEMEFRCWNPFRSKPRRRKE
jgi:acetylornithine deacetylase